jgi:hypothetical protein
MLLPAHPSGSGKRLPLYPDGRPLPEGQYLLGENIDFYNRVFSSFLALSITSFILLQGLRV